MLNNYIQFEKLYICHCMANQFEYRASSTLNSSEFTVIRVLYSLIIVAAAVYGVIKLLSGDYVLGGFLLLAALLNTFSPLTYFNFLGSKSPLDYFLIIDEEQIRYKLSNFSTSTSIPFSEITRIGYSEESLSVRLTIGTFKLIPANKIFGKAKKSELEAWVKAYRKKVLH